jgi:hypothetical protein
MYINTNSVLIDGVSLANYITNAKYGYHKLWSEDTGRNLKGDFTGSFNGIYPKITLTFKPLNDSEIQILAPILNKPTQNVTYDDPEKGRITIPTYNSDWEVTYENVSMGKGVTSSFISKKKRG